MEHKRDILIIGAGIVGLTLADTLHRRHRNLRITVLEKEPMVAYHSSGRNSGVLHAGFYYTADSLKARFTAEGNRRMQEYCRRYGLKLNPCGKVVVAQNEEELEALHELHRRGEVNGVRVSLITPARLRRIDPNIVTYKEALHSPDTATVDPVEICRHLWQRLSEEGVEFRFGEGYRRRLDRNVVETTFRARITAQKIVNCAGLYADKIAKEFGFGRHYTILPFKGLYLKYSGSRPPVTTNLYPVPNLKNPFLGVHYTVTVDGSVKIGPTAIPAFWRENYQGFERFDLHEAAEILNYEMRLFLSDAFGFRALAWEEMRKYVKSHFVSLAARMVHDLDRSGFTTWTRPGIRAQLLDMRSLELLQDFVVEGDAASVHVLNAVSPAFAGAFPFAEWVANHYID